MPLTGRKGATEGQQPGIAALTRMFDNTRPPLKPVPSAVVALDVNVEAVVAKVTKRILGSSTCIRDEALLTDARFVPFDLGRAVACLGLRPK